VGEEIKRGDRGEKGREKRGIYQHRSLSGRENFSAISHHYLSSCQKICTFLSCFGLKRERREKGFLLSSRVSFLTPV
jgi:hypothetical protein